MVNIDTIYKKVKHTFKVIAFEPSCIKCTIQTYLTCF